MSRSGAVALAPVPATDLVTALGTAGHELEADAERARRVLLEADRPSGAPALIEDVARWAHRLATELTRRIEQAVRLDLVVPARVGGHGAGERHLDLRGIDDIDDLLLALVELGALGRCHPPGDPGARRAALTSLAPRVRHRLADQVPEAIGPADGVPFALRDRANRRLLWDHVARAERRDGSRAPGGGRLLDDLRTWGEDDHLQVVKLDLDRGRAVLARGDLDTAEHVAVIVPGAGLTLDEVTRRHADWMDDLHAAMVHRGEAEGAAGGAATVLWLDYDPPSRLVPDAARRGPATDAASRMPAFLDGVATARPRLVTAIGHSYGSVVLGRSLADHPGRLAADQVIALGSPGLGVQLTGELALREDQRLLAATFDEDPVALAGRRHPLTGDLGRAVHGPDPRRLRGAETIALSTHDLADAGPVERHAQYLDADSSALRLIADLAAGSGRPPAE